MESSRGEWPNVLWELTAPESLVLYQGAGAKGGAVFKLALLDLVARGVLRLTETEEAGGLGRRRPGAVLTPGATPATPVPSVLAGVVRLFEGCPRRTLPDGTSGVPVADLTQAARRQYKSLDGYVRQDVLPRLIERGLFVSETRRRWGIIPVTQYILTPAGEAARADLKARLALGEHQLVHWIDQEPERAVNFVGFAGAAVLLMPAVLPELRRLRQLSAWSGPSLIYLGSLGSEEAAGLSGHDQWLDFDPSALDTLDSASGAIDSGIEQGGGQVAVTGGDLVGGVGDTGGGGDFGGGGAGGGGDGGGW